MLGDIKDRRVSSHLDLFRGVAALAVLAYHVRYRFFLDYKDLPSPSRPASLFYALTAFGHDAVMVFFVLSGYFIAGSVIRDRAARRWSWARYSINRLVRLYVVLLPGILIGMSWHRLGLWMYPDCPIYTGEPRAWAHDFFPVADRLGVGTAAANALFLQGIWARPVGSNEPLWSLGHEFWYYLLFPCLWLTLMRPGRWKTGLINLGLFAAILRFVGPGIRLYFLIWLMGAAATLLPQIRPLRRAYPLPLVIAATGLFAGLVAFAHTSHFRSFAGRSTVTSDFILAAGFTLLLYFLLHDQSRRIEDVYARSARALANLSFTLYVAHMPLLVFLRAALVPDTPWSPDAPHVAAAGLLAMVALAYAIVVAHFTEARTEQVRTIALDAARAVGLLAGPGPDRSASGARKVSSVAPAPPGASTVPELLSATRPDESRRG